MKLLPKGERVYRCGTVVGWVSKERGYVKVQWDGHDERHVIHQSELRVHYENAKSDVPVVSKPSA